MKDLLKKVNPLNFSKMFIKHFVVTFPEQVFRPVMFVQN